MKLRNYLFLAVGLLLCACSGDSEEEGNNPRKDIGLTANEIEIVSTQNESAFRMLRYFNANSDKDNFMVSPLSAQFALGMLANGARGNTLDEITSALNVSSLDELNELNRRLLSKLPKADKKTVFRSANSVWLNRGFNVLPTYSRTVAEYYRAESTTLELSTEAAKNKINAWCSKNTEGMIKQVLKEPFSNKIAFALVNALYFKGEWTEPFKKSATKAKNFKNADASTSRVDMVHQKYYIPYMDTGDFRLAKLTYGNGTYAMTVILPSENVTLDRALSSMDVETWETWKANRHEENCDIELPKFKISTDFDIIPYLSSLNIHDAFDMNAADFLAMSDISTFVSFAKQVTEISVDEKGTEAAAVTVVGGDLAALPPSHTIEFHVNRPFAFIIEETSTGAILFTGRVNKL